MRAYLAKETLAHWGWPALGSIERFSTEPDSDVLSVRLFDIRFAKAWAAAEAERRAKPSP